MDKVHARLTMKNVGVVEFLFNQRGDLGPLFSGVGDCAVHRSWGRRVGPSQCSSIG